MLTLRIKCPGLFFTFYLQLLNQALQTLCCIYWYLAHSCRIYSLGMYNQLHVLPCHLKSLLPCELWVYIFIMNAAFSQEKEREREQICCTTKHDLSQYSLIAYLTRQVSTDTKPIPAVVMCHLYNNENDANFLIK